MKTPILFYDGYCALCNYFVNFIIRFDPKQQFFFCPLDSDLGREIIQKYQVDSGIDSVILFDNNQVFTHHWAVFEILKKLPYPIKFLLVFRLIPSSFNKFLYTKIAANRHKLAKKYAACPVPPVKNKNQFLY
jgi:predicted DCC family thiol-disulfide oxidoreductase YuxK